MPNLIIMVGLPGSGKSWHANELVRRGEADGVISSDKIREELLGDENDQSANDKVFKIFYERANKLLSEGKNVVLDATNVTLKSRRRIFAEIKVPCTKICYIIATPIQECIKQDSERERSVGEEAIRKFERSFQCPQYFEGFDKIYGVETYGVHLMSSIGWIQKMKGFDQKNPHHRYDLLEHSKILANEIKKKTGSDLLWNAGIFHDIGKLYTQTFDDNGIAHYYNHAEVGTYFLLTHSNGVKGSIAQDCGFNFDILLELLFYVNYHMLAHNIKTEKAEKKYKKLFGEDLYNKLMLFAKCDNIATGVC